MILVVIIHSRSYFLRYPDELKPILIIVADDGTNVDDKELDYNGDLFQGMITVCVPATSSGDCLLTLTWRLSFLSSMLQGQVNIIQVNIIQHS